MLRWTPNRRVHVSQDGQEEQEGHVWQCIDEILKQYENRVIATLVGESRIFGNLSLQLESFSALVESAGTDSDGHVWRIVQYRLLDPLCPYQLSSIAVDRFDGSRDGFDHLGSQDLF